MVPHSFAFVRCERVGTGKPAATVVHENPRADKYGTAGSLAGEVIHSHRVFKQRIITRDHSDSAVGDKRARAVGFSVVAHGRAFGDVHVAIDYGLANTAMPPDIYMREQNAVVDVAIGINPHIG